MAPPSGLIRFDQLGLCLPYKRQLRVAIGLSSFIAIIGFLSVIFANIAAVFLPVILTLSFGIIFFFAFDILSVVKTPLAVNMNHPFFADEPIGKATVHVKFSDQPVSYTHLRAHETS